MASVLYCLEYGFNTINPERDAWFDRHPVFTLNVVDGKLVFIGADASMWSISVVKKYGNENGYARFTDETGTKYHVCCAPISMVRNHPWVINR